MGKERLGILISGEGTTMKKMIEACLGKLEPELNVAMSVGCVISNNPDAKGLIKAHNLGVPTEAVDPTQFIGADNRVDQEGFGQELLKKLRKHEVSVVTQNGWMVKTPESVIDAYPEMIFNQHPGPVPDFGGKNMFGIRVHAARLEFYKEVKRDPYTMAVAQRVYPEFDAGPIVMAGYVKILNSDTPETLQKRVLTVEHYVQIALLKSITHGKVTEKPNPTLVKPAERELLENIKKNAIRKYPRR